MQSRLCQPAPPAILSLPQTIVSLFLLLLIAIVTSAHNSDAAHAQDQQAQQTLEIALQALGGLERLRSLDSLYFKGKGSESRSADLQGPDPSTPIQSLPRRDHRRLSISGKDFLRTSHGPPRWQLSLATLDVCR